MFSNLKCPFPWKDIVLERSARDGFLRGVGAQDLYFMERKEIPLKVEAL